MSLSGLYKILRGSDDIRLPAKVEFFIWFTSFVAKMALMAGAGFLAFNWIAKVVPNEPWMIGTWSAVNVMLALFNAGNAHKNLKQAKYLAVAARMLNSSTIRQGNGSS